MQVSQREQVEGTGKKDGTGAQKRQRQVQTDGPGSAQSDQRERVPHLVLHGRVPPFECWWRKHMAQPMSPECAKGNADGCEKGSGDQCGFVHTEGIAPPSGFVKAWMCWGGGNPA